jgi:hypothetical protein
LIVEHNPARLTAVDTEQRLAAILIGDNVLFLTATVDIHTSTYWTMHF